MRTELSSGDVKGFGTDSGAAMVGIASSDAFGSAPEGFKPTDVMIECESVIVVDVPFTESSLSGTPEEYTAVRNETFRRADAIARDVAKKLKAEGYKAKTISSLGKKISLKHAAELAGLGVITKNYLLTNEKYGNLLWFGSILTDAKLEPDDMCQYSPCDDCNICVESCPSNALDDIGSFGKKSCSDTCWKMVDRRWILNCHLCREVCPYALGVTVKSR